MQFSVLFFRVALYLLRLLFASIFLGFKKLQLVTAVMKLKDACSLEGKL